MLSGYKLKLLLILIWKNSPLSFSLSPANCVHLIHSILYNASKCSQMEEKCTDEWWSGIILHWLRVGQARSELARDICCRDGKGRRHNHSLAVSRDPGFGCCYISSDHSHRRLRFRLSNKVVIITGAASGLGKASAIEFIRQGAKVILADIQTQLGESTAAQLGPNATFLQCDVTQESHLAAAVDLAIAQHGQLDVIFNNAAIAGPLSASITALDLADFDRTIATNLRSVVAGIKHAARVMIPRRSGCILCTASITGVLGGLGPHSYTVSKAAVIGLVRSTAAELCKHGVRVNCISPHAIPTPMGINAVVEVFPGVDDERLAEIVSNSGELEGAKCEEVDIAKAAVYLASDEAKYVSGHNLVVDGGYTAYKRLGLFMKE